MAVGARTVLVVDDSPDFLGFVEILLSEEGYAVSTASTLDEAERHLAAMRPDVVIADVRLPGQAPFALLDRLDADEATRSLPVLLCTGAVHDLQAEPDRLRRPRTAALLKPFDIEHLLLCIERLAAGHLPLAEHGALLAEAG